MGVSFQVAYSGISRLDWILGGQLCLDRRPVKPDSFFQRFNVFGYEANQTESHHFYHNWYHTLRAYAVHENIRMFDSSIKMASFCKPLDLLAANKIGLRIPETMITDSTIPKKACIFKPVMGGSHTVMLKSKSDISNGPGFVQELCPGTEYRVYVVGDKCFTFRMDTKSLDYREKNDVNVVPVPNIQEAEKIKTLSHEKGLYFSSSDLKCDMQGRLCFLEINTSPMFSVFDKAVDGRLSEAMVEWLDGKDLCLKN
jgi:hypothetical protein